MERRVTVLLWLKTGCSFTANLTYQLTETIRCGGECTVMGAVRRNFEMGGRELWQGAKNPVAASAIENIPTQITQISSLQFS